MEWDYICYWNWPPFPSMTWNWLELEINISKTSQFDLGWNCVCLPHQLGPWVIYFQFCLLYKWSRGWYVQPSVKANLKRILGWVEPKWVAREEGCICSSYSRICSLICMAISSHHLYVWLRGRTYFYACVRGRISHRNCSTVLFPSSL